MKVLFLSGLQIHPTLSGGNLRSFALGNALQRHDLEVFVYSLVGRKHDYLARRPSEIQAWPEGIPEYVDRGGKGFLAQFGSYALGLPPLWITAYLAAAAASPGGRLLPRLLRERLAWSDAVVADFPFVHPIFKAAGRRLRVLNTHNLEHRMHGAAWLRALVRGLEKKAARASDVVVTCCDGDREFFRHAIVVPNGVDLRRFRDLHRHREDARRALGVSEETRLFLFTASKYGPNREAFDSVVDLARRHARLLVEQRIHILVVGSVTPAPLRLAGLTATGKVDAVEPYFAAADAALNLTTSGAGTNVKMGEYMAARLPILSTRFGARGFQLEDGETAFLFEKDGLAPLMSRVRRFFDEDPARLQRMADAAYAANAAAIDMDAAVTPLVAAMKDARGRLSSGERVLAAAFARAEEGVSWLR